MSEEEEYTWIIPLVNFKSEINRLEIDSETCLKKMNRRELAKVKILADNYNQMQKLSLLAATHALELHGKDALALAEKPVWALRLMKRGDVKYSVSFRIYARGKGIRAVATGYGKLDFSMNVYSLCETETRDLQQLMPFVRGLDKKPYLKFPIEKFTETYEKINSEDKIVDFMITFESLVFYDAGDLGRKGTSMAIAVSMLLGKNQKERSRIRSKMITAYDIRNAKVHGLARKMEEYRKKEIIPELAVEVEDYLRRSLRKYVEE
jgi:hypothetical protein